MHLGVGHEELAVPVDERDAVAWSSGPLLQIGQCDRHLKFASQRLEMLDECCIPLDSLGLPTDASLF